MSKASIILSPTAERGHAYAAVIGFPKDSVVTTLTGLRGMDLAGQHVISLEDGELEHGALRQGASVYRFDDSPSRCAWDERVGG